MKNLLVKIACSLLLLLTSADVIFAASMSIPVSCSIPAVPGLNAPLTGSIATNKQEDKSVISVKNILPQASAKKEPELIQKDTEKNKTLYPR